MEVAATLNLGKSKSAYSMTVKILALPNSIQNFMNENAEHLTAKHGRVMLEQKVPEAEMDAIANKVIEQGWSARALEKYCQGLGRERPQAKFCALNQRQTKAISHLSEILEQPVKHQQRGEKHIISLECASDAELNRLLKRFAAL